MRSAPSSREIDNRTISPRPVEYGRCWVESREVLDSRSPTRRIESRNQLIKIIIEDIVTTIEQALELLLFKSTRTSYDMFEMSLEYVLIYARYGPKYWGHLWRIERDSGNGSAGSSICPPKWWMRVKRRGEIERRGRTGCGFPREVKVIVYMVLLTCTLSLQAEICECTKKGAAAFLK
jgi:hypothetical protein